jgi:hypothetical protein
MSRFPPGLLIHPSPHGSAYEPQEIPMVNLALTMLPVIVTFAVAAWNSPSDEVQPRPALSRDSHCK